MVQRIEFYLERAEEAAQEARDATLVNVRERALRAEAAWRVMVNRERGIEENRARRASESEHVNSSGQNGAG